MLAGRRGRQGSARPSWAAPGRAQGLAHIRECCPWRFPVPASQTHGARSFVGPCTCCPEPALFFPCPRRCPPPPPVGLGSRLTSRRPQWWPVHLLGVGLGTRLSQPWHTLRAAGSSSCLPGILGNEEHGVFSHTHLYADLLLLLGRRPLRDPQRTPRVPARWTPSPCQGLSDSVGWAWAGRGLEGWGWSCSQAPPRGPLREAVQVLAAICPPALHSD